MSKITFDNKISGNQLLASEVNQIKQVVNENAVKLLEITKSYTYNLLSFSPVINWFFDKSAPNKQLTVSADTTINISNTEDGDCGILRLTKVNGNEIITLTGNIENGKSLSSGPGQTDILAFLNVNGTLYWFISNFGNVITTPQLDSPSLTATAVSASQINLTWTSVSKATNYILERSDNFTFTSKTQIYSGGETSFIDLERSPGVTYYYRIKARASEYIDSVYNVANVATPGTSTQLAPPILNTLQISSHQINLTWTSVVNASSYQLQTSSTSSFTNPITLYSGSSTSFSHTELSASTTYFYRIKSMF